MFRPCIDLHEGKVKQIVGGTLGDAGLRTNFVSDKPAAWFAELYRRDGLIGGHVIQLGAGNEAEARAALAAFPGGLQIGGGVNAQNARGWLDAGASHVIVTSWVFREGRVDWARLDELVKAIGKETAGAGFELPQAGRRLFCRHRPLAEIHGTGRQRGERCGNLPEAALNFWFTRWTWKACAAALTVNWLKSSAAGRRFRRLTPAARIRWPTWKQSRDWAGGRLT